MVKCSILPPKRVYCRSIPLRKCDKNYATFRDDRPKKLEQKRSTIQSKSKEQEHAPKIQELYNIYMKYVVKNIDQIHQTCCNCFGPHPATRCTTWTLLNAVPGETSPLGLGLAHLYRLCEWIFWENRQYRKPWLFPWNMGACCSCCFP